MRVTRGSRCSARAERPRTGDLPQPVGALRAGSSPLFDGPGSLGLASSGHSPFRAPPLGRPYASIGFRSAPPLQPGRWFRSGEARRSVVLQRIRKDRGPLWVYCSLCLRVSKSTGSWRGLLRDCRPLRGSYVLVPPPLGGRVSDRMPASASTSTWNGRPLVLTRQARARRVRSARIPSCIGNGTDRVEGMRCAGTEARRAS
jgi:hypothetical protein